VGEITDNDGDNNGSDDNDDDEGSDSDGNEDNTDKDNAESKHVEASVGSGFFVTLTLIEGADVEGLSLTGVAPIATSGNVTLLLFLGKLLLERVSVPSIFWFSSNFCERNRSIPLTSESSFLFCVDAIANSGVEVEILV